MSTRPEPTGDGPARAISPGAGPSMEDRPLTAAAARLREAFDADMAVVRLREGTEGEPAIGVAASPRLGAQTLATAAAAGALPFDRGVGADGEPVHWPRLDLDAAMIAGADHAMRAALAGASAIAVALAPPALPRAGTIALICVAGRPPLRASDARTLAGMAPDFAWAIQAHVLRARALAAEQVTRAVMGASPVGLVLCDRDRRITFVNPAAGALLAIDPGSVAGHSLEAFAGTHLKHCVPRPELVPRPVPEGSAHRAQTLRWQAQTIAGAAIELTHSPLRDGAEAIGSLLRIVETTAERDALARARRAVEMRDERLRGEERRLRENERLTRAGFALASALTPGEVHRRLLDEAARLVAGHRFAVFVAEENGGLAAAATLGFSPTAAERPTWNAAAGPLARALAGRRVQIFNDAESDPRWPAEIVAGGDVRSVICVPLAIGERVYGALVIGSPRPEAFTERDVRPLSELAGHAAAALRNALAFAAKRDIAEVLQESLLAREVPDLPGLSVAALYRAARGAMVGGDFSDVWEMAPGRVAAMVGDVSGKGPPAAAVTAMVRHLVEGLGRHQSDPAALMHELNQLLCPRLPEEALVTVMLAVHDRARDRLTRCNAGHPPPFLVRGEGTIIELGQPDPPCAAFCDATYHRHEVAFRRADQLVMYTDGLTEARRGGEQFGPERLAREVLNLRLRRPSALARGIYAAARLWSEGELADDVAIAVVRRDEDSPGPASADDPL